METIKVITPLLDPEITDEEAKAVVDGMTEQQKDMAVVTAAIGLPRKRALSELFPKECWLRQGL